MAFNSDEVNLLVYRYLEESGFRHSAFTFGYESNVLNAGIDSTSIPRGALMSLLQKGVLFAEAEVFSLLNDGELDARFEKAIGCMTILECAMCDSAKIKALQRRAGGVQQQRSTTITTNDEQQQQQPQNQRRTPTRTPTMTAATTMDHKQQISCSSSCTNTQTNQIHGQNSCRPDSATSSMKSNVATFQQSAQQQSYRDREFRVQQAPATSNQMVSNVNIPMTQRNAYRPTAPSQEDRTGTTGLAEHAGIKCNPTLASASSLTSGSVSMTTSNHLPSGPNVALMHPFYAQQQSFAKQNITLGNTAAGIADSNSPFLTSTNAVNIANGSGATLNRPNSVTTHAIQINSSSTSSPYSSLSALHQHHPQPQSSGGSNQSDLTRLIINGTTPYLTASSTTGPSAKRSNANS